MSTKMYHFDIKFNPETVPTWDGDEAFPHKLADTAPTHPWQFPAGILLL